MCLLLQQVPTPVDVPCLGCTQSIAQDDRGIVTAYDDGQHVDLMMRPWHLKCFLEAVGVDAQADAALDAMPDPAEAQKYC